jgi:hypothetical protein
MEKLGEFFGTKNYLIMNSARFLQMAIFCGERFTVNLQA